MTERTPQTKLYDSLMIEGPDPGYMTPRVEGKQVSLNIQHGNETKAALGGLYRVILPGGEVANRIVYPTLDPEARAFKIAAADPPEGYSLDHISR
jgi:hypothetical protein